MKDQFVPYELAVKLKELGFDEKCLTKWGRTSLKLYDNYIHCTNKDDIVLSGDFVSAPLYQQALEWFRKIGYGVFIETWVNDGSKKFRGRNNYPPAFVTDVCDTHTEARIALLNKLIEIVKHKQSNEDYTIQETG